MKTRSNKFTTLRAIYPNVGVEAWYHAQLVKLVASMAASFEAAVLPEYSEVVGDASPVDFIKRAMAKWSTKWTDKIDGMAERLAKQFADRAFGATQVAMRQAFKQAGWTVAFKPTKYAKQKYAEVVAENVNLIRSIPAKYLRDVETKVWNSAIRRGGDLYALSVDLKHTYKVTAKRAALIARDQNSKAKATIEQARCLELGITHAIWQHSAGGKEPRPTHVHNNGKRFNLKTGWFDPDADGPGKGAYILPGELINCKCTMRAHIAAFDD